MKQGLFILLVAAALVLGAGTYFSIYRTSGETFVNTVSPGEPVEFNAAYDNADLYQATRNPPWASTCAEFWNFPPYNGIQMPVDFLVYIDDLNSGQRLFQEVNSGVYSCGVNTDSNIIGTYTYQFTSAQSNHPIRIGYTVAGTNENGYYDILTYEYTDFMVQANQPQECTNTAQARCASPSNIMRCDGNSYSIMDHCGYPSTCQGADGSASCSQICTPGQIQCQGLGFYLTCNAAGEAFEGLTQVPANQQCVNDALVPRPADEGCGDGICRSWESELTCPQDCEPQQQTACGNSICEFGEQATCLQDCTILENQTEPQNVSDLFECPDGLWVIRESYCWWDHGLNATANYTMYRCNDDSACFVTGCCADHGGVKSQTQRNSQILSAWENLPEEQKIIVVIVVVAGAFLLLSRTKRR